MHYAGTNKFHFQHVVHLFSCSQFIYFIVKTQQKGQFNILSILLDVYGLILCMFLTLSIYKLDRYNMVILSTANHIFFSLFSIHYIVLKEKNRYILLFIIILYMDIKFILLFWDQGLAIHFIFPHTYHIKYSLMFDVTNTELLLWCYL